jgi:hypothetical protein
MFTKTMRLLGASALVGAAVTAISPSAKAADYNLGGWDVQVDNTVSFGASWLMKERENQYIPLANGGPADTSRYGTASTGTAAIAADPADGSGNYANAAERGQALAGAALAAGCDTGYGNFCQEVIAIPNFDGSINADDGRLNFDKGDLFSSPFRLTTEVEGRNGPFTAFAKLNIWHDLAAMDEGAYNRGGALTDDGEENVGQNAEILDFYISYDGDIGNMPFTLRAGRQVINWGEATFIPGGNSAFNPIDVATLRRPGSEIKEALLPVEALYGSIALTEDLSVEAYVGGWDDYRLEGGGTPFAISDSAFEGTSTGNPQDIYFIGGGPKSGDQFACNGAAPMAALNTDQSLATAGIINAVLATNMWDCANNPNLDATRDWTTGMQEVERVAAGDTNFITGLPDDEGEAAMGLAVRWYAENLNSTEFALYYQKTDSRLPYISFKTGKAGVKAVSTSSKSSTTGRGAGPTGCYGIATSTVPALAGKLYNPAYAAVMMDDEHGLLTNAGIQQIAQATADGLAQKGAAAAAGVAAAAPFLAFDGYTRTANLPALSVAKFQETVCLLHMAQLVPGVSFGSAFDPLGQLPTGATNLAATPNINLYLEFPEVETYGLSFNTTVAGWGVQGDFTYRPEVPLQHDTDVLTIASLFNNCAFTTAGLLENIYLTGSTYASEYGTIGCTDQNRTLPGYTTSHDAITWDIGTTATFTRSNPVVSFLRSDLGIFLTEFQGVMIDGIEDDRGSVGGVDLNLDGDYSNDAGQPGTQGIAPLSNVCVGGSDLPLASILSIDNRTAGDASDPSDDNPQGHCRPTDNSWGLVLMAQLQYNNVFGTPIGLRPQIIYTTGVSGYSPSPIGFWREGQGSTAISLTADYLGKWTGNLSYRTYHGDLDRTRMLDRDTMSVSLTYAF